MASEHLELEAKELGITFNAKIGDEKLQAKIDEYYKSQETSEKEVIAAVQAKEAAEVKEEAKPAVKGKESITERAVKAFEEAKKIRIATIIDNDQRVNNQTTMCTANWSNQFHDLGTRSFPLNVPIEIPQGFINVLRDVKISQHVKDPRTQLSRAIMRNRYSISIETELEAKAGI